MIVYIWGSLTADNFTPRKGKDTIGKAGQAPGLSASTTVPTGRKAQGIDLDLLAYPLRAFCDVPEKGGTPGHVAIAPIEAGGEIDIARLEEWASMRGTGKIHAFTQNLLDAVTQPNVRPSDT